MMKPAAPAIAIPYDSGWTNRCQPLLWLHWSVATLMHAAVSAKQIAAATPRHAARHARGPRCDATVERPTAPTLAMRSSTQSVFDGRLLPPAEALSARKT